MSDSPTPYNADPPAAPPTVSMPIAGPPVRASSWPTVLGIIAVVLGGLSIVTGLWTVATMTLFTAVTDRTVESTANGEAMIMTYPTAESHPWMIVLGLGAAVMGAILVIVGIGILKRRPWAIPVSRAWAGAKIFFTIAYNLINYQIQQEMMSTMPQGQNMPAMAAPFMTIFLVIGLAVGIVWGCALPVFLLIWFRREKIQAETAEWA